MRALITVILPLILGGAWVAAYGAPLDRHGSFPSASPDGKHIVFASSRGAVVPAGSTAWLYMHIYSMDVDGSNVRQLTDSSTSDTAPIWTPDGKWILFGTVNGKTDQETLEAMHPDGSARHTLMTGDFLPWVRVSPDSRRVIFTSTVNDLPQSINTVNIDGSDPRPLATGLDHTWDGIWSPDGKNLAFSVYPGHSDDPSGRKTDVYIAHADGSNPRLLATYQGFIQVPSWSADGRSIAYQTYTGKKGEADIVVLDVATGRFRAVSHRESAYLDECPSWLPDGRLLFQSTRDGRFEVYVMDADGSGIRDLTKSD